MRTRRRDGVEEAARRSRERLRTLVAGLHREPTPGEVEAELVRVIRAERGRAQRAFLKALGWNQADLSDPDYGDAYRQFRAILGPAGPRRRGRA